LAALLGGLTQREAAQKTGVTDRTIRDWLRQPAFQAELRRARQTLWLEATTQLHGLTKEAVEALRSIIADEKARAWDRMMAARTVLELTRRAADGDDVQARLADLEARVTGG